MCRIVLQSLLCLVLWMQSDMRCVWYVPEWCRDSASKCKVRQGYSECGAIPNIIDSSSVRTIYQLERLSIG